MRTRFVAILFALLATILVSLCAPLGHSYAAEQTSTVYFDRLSDLSHIDESIPANPHDVDRSALLASLRRYDDLYGIHVAVLGADGGTTITTTPGVPGADPMTRHAVAAALAGRVEGPPADFTPWDRTRLVIALPVKRAGDVVGAVVSVSDTSAARTRIMTVWIELAGAGLLALAVGLFLAVRLTGWVLRPVAVLDAAAQRISRGELQVRSAGIGGPPELRRLSTAFNDMVDSVQASLDAQRAFVADASHQLRNPLGALLVRLEGLALTVGPPHRSAVESAADDGRHLGETLDRMLELARAEHLQTHAGEVDVAAIVDERLASWRVVADHRTIELQRSGETQAFGWHDRVSLAGAVDAVVDNALKFSPEGGTVGVSVRTAMGGGVVVTVVDQGPGVAADELSKVAVRFWRGPGQADLPGSGLGLSIATTLMVRRGGSLRAERLESGGFRVILTVAGRSDRPELGA